MQNWWLFSFTYIFLYLGEELVFSIEVHIPDVMEGKAAMNRNPVTYEKCFFLNLWDRRKKFLRERERERPLIYVCIDFPVN